MAEIQELFYQYPVTNNLTYSNYWTAQTFRVRGDTRFNLTSIKLYCYKKGSPSTVTVSIRAVDSDGKPTGADLSSGTFDGNTLSLTTEINQEVIMSSIELESNTDYAIVIRLSAGSILNYLALKKNSTKYYEYGNYLWSSNSGVAWTNDTTNNILFEVWGDRITGTAGTRIVNTNYPNTKGLIAGTTTQTGRVTNLIPEKSFVPQRYRKGIE